MRVGLFGGSFNPAHDGHLHVSERALVRLGLDQVWWLVSPQNPLKPPAGMAPFAERLAAAATFVKDRRIKVSDMEAHLDSGRTIHTLRRLKQQYPANRFVWIMGADNLIEAHRWYAWAEIFATVPIAVFDRPTYSLKALAAVAARRFAGSRVPEGRAGLLAGMEPPAWVFMHIPLHGASATQIRAKRGA